MRSGLEKILTGKEEKKGNLNLLILSELELATKLADPLIYNNLSNLIQNYPDKIDAIFIKGGVAYIADKFSKRRAEYLDMLEDNIRGKYGEDAYRYVKGNNLKQRDHGSVDSFGEAFRLAKYTLKDIVNKASERGIPIYYEYGDKDYNNVNSLISIIYNLIKKSNGKNDNNKEDKTKEKLAKEVKIDVDMLSKIESYGFSAERWKNKDKNGIKDIAIKIYNSYIVDMLSPIDENKKSQVVIINGFKINSTHAINGRLNENNSFITPLQNGQKRAIEYANKQYQTGDPADIYIRTHDKGGFDFTSIEFEDKKPVLLICTPPLQDPEVLKDRSNSWSRTVDAKRFDSSFDSGAVFVKINDDKRILITHIGYNLLKKNIDISNIRDMYKIILVGDMHIGAPSMGNDFDELKPRASYELMEAMEMDLKQNNFSKDDTYIEFLGDIFHGGVDKAARSDILENKRYGYKDTIKRLENILSEESPTVDQIRKQLIENIYGVSIFNLGEQIKEGAPIISNIAKSCCKRAGVIPGNHVASAALNENEADIVGSILESNGIEVDYPNKVQQRNELYRIFGYPTNTIHSTGYRGWKDGGKENLDMVYYTGNKALIQLSADEHRPHENIAIIKRDGNWYTLVAVKPPAFQDYSTFEKNIVKKNKSPRGYAALYLPKDHIIGTGYTVYELVTEATLDEVLNKNGGSTIDKLANQMYSLIYKK